jgi:hypothetical protein
VAEVGGNVARDSFLGWKVSNLTERDQEGIEKEKKEKKEKQEKQEKNKRGKRKANVNEWLISIPCQCDRTRHHLYSWRT